MRARVGQYVCLSRQTRVVIMASTGWGVSGDPGGDMNPSQSVIAWVSGGVPTYKTYYMQM